MTLPLFKPPTLLFRLLFFHDWTIAIPPFQMPPAPSNQSSKGSKQCSPPHFDHLTPHLRTLHWLPIGARIKYKLCTLCFGAITSTGAVYLSDLLKIYTHSRQLQSSADIRITVHFMCQH